MQRLGWLLNMLVERSLGEWLWILRAVLGMCPIASSTPLRTPVAAAKSSTSSSSSEVPISAFFFRTAVVVVVVVVIVVAFGREGAACFDGAPPPSATRSSGVRGDWCSRASSPLESLVVGVVGVFGGPRAQHLRCEYAGSSPKDNDQREPSCSGHGCTSCVQRGRTSLAIDGRAAATVAASSTSALSLSTPLSSPSTRASRASVLRQHRHPRRDRAHLSLMQLPQRARTRSRFPMHTFLRFLDVLGGGF